MPLSPWLDMEATGETFETNVAKDLIVTRDLIEGMTGMFLGESGNRQDPLANPLHADLKGFPPIYIQTGAAETDSRNSQSHPRLPWYSRKSDRTPSPPDRRTRRNRIGRQPVAIRRTQPWTTQWR
jgi:hypothetical protein